MQFTGSVRAPGDKDPGVRVALDIDEYHLEIRRDSELIGRYYLADVEVARDIAERFILFLGDDEVEFLADDALQFAYGGVTAMQEGWLSAQKRKRRHRRAADEAARRKDGQRSLEVTAPLTQSLHVSDSDTVRSRRRLAGQTAAGDRPAPTPAPTAVTEAPVGKRAARRQAAAVDNATPAPEPAPSVPTVDREDPVTPVPDAKATQAVKRSAPAKQVGSPVPDTSLAARRKKITAEAGPKRPDELGRVRVPEPVSGPGPNSTERRAEASATVIEHEPVRTAEDPDAEVRFALEGHHPAETSTGLFARLRRQPKPPENHVHKFKESGSSVGLIRRVCIECAHVSIGSDD